VSAVVFFAAAAGAIAGAVGVVLLRDAFYSVLALVAHLVCLAVLFLLLRAEFVAAVQVLVYAGAVMVLYVFVVAYVGGDAGGRFELAALGERMRGVGPGGSRMRTGGAVLGGALLLELLIALLGTGLHGISGHGAPYSPGPRTFGTPAYIGQLLLTRFLVAFEVASFLLLIAAVGAVVLARRRGGLGGEGAPERPGPLGLAAPRDAGAMAEAVGPAIVSARAYAPEGPQPRGGGAPGPRGGER
jgi:NADH:ubiquinone oxidoreductase subunit 6 (subunit J)